MKLKKTNKLKKVMQKKEYSIYGEIFKFIETCRIIELRTRSIIIKIDEENNIIIIRQY